MTNRPFGRTGLYVSPLGFGAAPIGYLNTDQDQAGRTINLLLDAGVNLIDTAAAYEGSESMIATAVGHRREQFVLVSKCGPKLPDVADAAWSPKLIAASVDRSLARLKTDRLDVVLLHSCTLAVLQQGDALAELVKARDAGKIRFVGYSGDNDAAVYAANLAEVAVVQTSVNIADQANIDIVLPAARKKNLGVIAKRPIANAAWKDPARQPGFYGDYASTYSRRLARMELTPTDLGYPDDSDDVWSDLALRFTLSLPGVSAAIVGTTNPENAKKNLAAAEKGPLAAETVRKIRDRFVTARADESWPGQG